MKHYWTLLLLLLSIFFTGYQSQVHGLTLLAMAAALWIFRRVQKNRIAPLRKSILYAAILPFSFWWVLSPNAEGIISPWLFFIPAWFCLFLALMQWRSVGRGGELVFVRFNAMAAFLFALRNPDRFSIILAVALLTVFLLGIRPKSSFFKWAFSLLLAVALAVAFVMGSFEIKQNYSQKQSGNWGDDFYLSRTMMGFDPVASLGSFEKNYNSRYEDQVVLRLWTNAPPTYLKSIAYERYLKGLWKIATDHESFYPARYEIDYAVFKSQDTTDVPVWVQSSLNTFDYIFAPKEAAGIGVKGADSAFYLAGGTWHASGAKRSDWYYYKGSRTSDTASGENFLIIAQRDLPLVKRVALEMGLDTLLSTAEMVNRIRVYFTEHFEYSLYIPLKRKDNPLEVFWETRKGYCEYYATLGTLLLRYKNIPARYVVGFAFPEMADNGKYAFFRRNNSHSWVEYRDSTWKIMDPTPMVAGASAEYSFIQRWQESLRARSAYGFHILKDGTWRKKVDVLQVLLEHTLQSPWFYAVIAGMILILVYLRMRHGLKKSQSWNDSRALYWIPKIRKADRTLHRLGFERFPGETIGNYILRLESTPVPKHRKLFNRALEVLKKYQQERWRRK